MSGSASPLRLTQTVKKGGCAAKVAAVELRKLLANVAFPPASADLLIDGRDFDDAAVFRVTPDVAVVQTLDFFTPIVDDAFDFGRIAAVNALSDVYAMGAKPSFALAILAFPLGEIPNDAVAQIMNGACAALKDAGAALAGGHSIDDDTVKFGLCATGFVHPDRIWSNGGAKPGDVLILTKALGTGATSAALKRGEIGDAEMRPAIASMSQLNDAPALFDEPELRGAVHAATDVTGFGLAGHAMQMAKASGALLRFRLVDLPLLPGAADFLARGFLTKAHRTNKDYVSAALDDRSGASEAEAQILFDPQTSGGLLLAVDPARAELALARLRARFPASALVGRVESPSGSGGGIAVS